MKKSTWDIIEVIEKVLWILGLLIYAWFLRNSVEISGNTLAQEPMAPIGFGLVLLGTLSAKLIQVRFVEKVKLLTRSGAIFDGYGHLDGLSEDTNFISTWVFIPMVVGLCITYLIGLNISLSEPGIYLIIGGMIAVYIVSTRFSFGVASGLCTLKITKHTEFFLHSSHPDKAAGFGHLGYYYFKQALVILIPTAFMAGWLLLAYATVQAKNIEMPEQNTFAYEFDGYMRYDDDTDSVYVKYWDCEKEKRTFIWSAAFYKLILVNLIVFLFAWAIPNSVLAKQMKVAKRRVVYPAIEELERKLKNHRRLQTKGFSDLRSASHLSDELYYLRMCPTFPLPVKTVATVFLSNISAIFGLLGLSLFQ